MAGEECDEDGWAPHFDGFDFVASNLWCIKINPDCVDVAEALFMSQNIPRKDIVVALPEESESDSHELSAIIITCLITGKKR
jgi:hypothetical protein